MRRMTVKVRLSTMASAIAMTACLGAIHAPAYADEAAAKRWIDTEFQPSTLSKDEQMKEMQWFINAAKPFVGMEISIVSETITTHEYESKVMAKAFTEITGIKVKHDIIQEGDVVEKIQTQMQSGRSIYDGWINDSDLIGTHFRYNQTVSLTDFMAGEGKDVTLPTLDVADFIGRSFGTAPDGKLFQLPDQQFANLYWFRYDWFTNPDYKARIQGQVRLRARRAGELVGLRGHRRVLHRPSRRSAASRSMATWTTARRIRRSAGGSPTPGCRWPATATRAFPTASRSTNGASGSREFAVRSAPAVDARRRHQRPGGGLFDREVLDWLNKYAPPQARGMTFSEAGAVPPKATSPSRSSGTPPSPPTW